MTLIKSQLMILAVADFSATSFNEQSMLTTGFPWEQLVVPQVPLGNNLW